MISSKTITFIILLLAFSIITEDLSAQRRTTRRDTEEQAEDNAPKDWLAISLGTLGFFNGFSVSGKFAYAYELENRISVGANGKFFFDNVNRNGPDLNLFTYGAAVFARLRITDEIFAQGEYNLTIFDEDDQFIDNSRLYPSVGGGYKSGFGPWTGGFHLMLPLDDQVRNSINLEYWIDFNYKF